jgi:hypothetical protein
MAGDTKKCPFPFTAGHFLLIGILYNRYIDGTGALVALLDIKTEPLTFIQRSESGPLDCTVMNKYITALITFDKTESLFLIKPLHFTFCQNRTLLSQLFSASGHHNAENKKTTPVLDSTYQPAVVIPLGLQNMNTQLFPITPPFKIHYVFDTYRQFLVRNWAVA